jgi:CBS-domain-containing membrane protein
MRAIDVMVRHVVTVHPDTDVTDAIRLLAEHDVSALPVVDPTGNLVSVLSEADLIHRVGSPAEHKALLALAENAPGVSRVADEMMPAY